MRSTRATAVATRALFFSSRRRHTRFDCDWSSDVCSSDLDISSSRIRWSHNPPQCQEQQGCRQSRSEEHTSELQSQSNLVCRLLLEKKKPNRRTIRRREKPLAV